MARTLPFFQFYPGDWIADPVSGCSLAAQGLWLRLLLLMHDSERYGHLSQAGKPIPVDRVCRLIGCSLAEYETFLGELMDAGVPSVTPRGVLFSRRMVKDEENRAGVRARKARSRSSSAGRGERRDIAVTEAGQGCDTSVTNVDRESDPLQKEKAKGSVNQGEKSAENLSVILNSQGKPIKTKANCHSDVTPESREGHSDVTGRVQRSEFRGQKSEFTSGDSTNSGAIVASGGAPPPLEIEPPKPNGTPPPTPAVRAAQGAPPKVAALPRTRQEEPVRPETIATVSRMLFDWTGGRLGNPDETIVRILLATLGGGGATQLESLANWLKYLRRKGKSADDVKSWGWFPRVLAADLKAIEMGGLNG